MGDNCSILEFSQHLKELFSRDFENKKKTPVMFFSLKITRGSSSESSSNRDWAEGELFHQEPLSIEIRNGTLETGNLTEVGEDGRLEMGNGKREKWTLDIGLEQFWMGNWPEHKHNECELTESNSAFYQLSVRLDNTLTTLRFFPQLILTTGS